MKLTDKYVFFWGEHPSQWFPCNFVVDGITYCSTEQYMMHQKALTFGDTEIANEIMITPHPADQKKLGKKVKNFDRTVWDKVCLGIVYKGNLAKYSQNEDLKKELLSTGDRIFVEASPEDYIWGVQLHENDLLVVDPINWKGQNLLGFALTLVKQELLDQLKKEYPTDWKLYFV